MYKAFFNHLPGPFWLRIILMIILTLCLAAFLFEVAFPLIGEIMPNTESTVDA